MTWLRKLRKFALNCFRPPFFAEVDDDVDDDDEDDDDEADDESVR